MNEACNQNILDEIKELAPPYMHNILNRAMNESEFNFDREGMILTGEINPSSSVVRTSVIRREDSLWCRIQDEIFDCICTASTEYKDERSKAKDIILFVAGALAAKLQVTATALTGMIALAVLAVFKISKNVWCKAQGDKRKSSLQAES
ncbi:hypothetical protein CCL14_25770 [Pseudomonas syringae]|uniref:hypothetical protein n=1 Tax=Pseudomonas syringae TaxID=317 RepID=UPI000BB63465|nr:hypothetical protein [Pseudomonas syringae]PBP33044.1 hypothetical protein CCL14_25770 [Pseudomonas syringae]